MQARPQEDSQVAPSQIEVVIDGDKKEEMPPVKVAVLEKDGDGKVPGAELPPPPADLTSMPVYQQVFINGQWVLVQVPPGQALQPVAGQQLPVQAGQTPSYQHQSVPVQHQVGAQPTTVHHYHDSYHSRGLTTGEAILLSGAGRSQQQTVIVNNNNSTVVGGTGGTTVTSGSQSSTTVRNSNDCDCIGGCGRCLSCCCDGIGKAVCGCLGWIGSCLSAIGQCCEWTWKNLPSCDDIYKCVTCCGLCGKIDCKCCTDAMECVGDFCENRFTRR
jgi:hypothetical protein